jgi:hypothetical protein
MAKTPKVREGRPAQVIKPVIAPISSDIKTKISNAFQAVVTRIKEEHL